MTISGGANLTLNANYAGATVPVPTGVGVTGSRTYLSQ